ncbi:MAG TPA: sigma-70 family RNA polymerase sigma factor [Candidatus Saccharimonadales bacterium]|nr:sigma-70 family RNA polymerase sigma factor [Candidatus Saccharimonadales bacterium]
MQHKDEAELIARSLDGDHLAYAALVERYKNALYHHCFVIVRSPEAAEDIAQETFITAYYKLVSYNPEYRLSTWLFKIATNKALNYIKRARHEITDVQTVLEQIVSARPDPQQQAEDAELHACVERLQPKYRAVISLYYWQGKSYPEIAHIVGVPEGTVKGWMHRAKSELRKELA